MIIDGKRVVFVSGAKPSCPVPLLSGFDAVALPSHHAVEDRIVLPALHLLSCVRLGDKNVCWAGEHLTELPSVCQVSEGYWMSDVLVLVFGAIGISGI